MSAAFEFPTYGRGIDPTPDLDFGFMFRRPDEKIGCVAPQKIVYEQKFEDFLKGKLLKALEKKQERRPNELEEPEIIQFLKEEFLRLTRKTAVRLDRELFVAELRRNYILAHYFGFVENTKETEIRQQIDNIGGLDGISLDEYLLFYQISKNNLIKAAKSGQDSKASTTNDSFFVKNEEKNNETSRIVEAFKPQIRKLYKKVEIMLNGEVKRKPFVEKIMENQTILTNFEELINQISSGAVSANNLLEEILSKEDESFSLLMFIEHFVFLLTFAKIQLESYYKETLLSEDHLALLKSLFDSLPKQEHGGVSISDFLDALVQNERINEILNVPARESKEVSEIPDETLGQVLERIYQEAPDLLSWEDFSAYFTVKGCPSENGENQYHDKTESNSKTKTKPKGTKYAITVPEPFKFDRREKRKTLSIRERRLQEMLNQDEKKIQESIKITYKAKPVPPEVIIPLFEQIMKEQEAKRLQVKANSIEITKANEKPFSFYYRDLTKTKPEPQELPKHVFTANPVPWTTSVPLYDRMVSEREIARKERINTAALESLALSMMPPRMEASSRQESAKTPIPKSKKLKKSFKSKAVPDFRKLQAEFQQTLDASKQSFNPTKPEPFKFNQTHSSTDFLKMLDKEADAHKKWGQPTKQKRSNSVSMMKKPKITPSTTEKTKAMVEYKLAQKRESKMKEALRMQEDEDRRMRHEMMRSVVQNCSIIKDNSSELQKRREESIRQRKQEIEENERDYYDQRAEIYERVRKRPLLVEQVAMQKLAQHLEQLGPVRELLSQEESNDYSQNSPNQSY